MNGDDIYTCGDCDEPLLFSPENRLSPAHWVCSGHECDAVYELHEVENADFAEAEELDHMASSESFDDASSRPATRFSKLTLFDKCLAIVAAATLLLGVVSVVKVKLIDDNSPITSNSNSTAPARATATTTRPTVAANSTASRLVYRTKGNFGLVTIATPDGIQQHDSGGPWRFDNVPPGEFVSISIQNANDFGSVTCEIWYGGDLIADNTSTASYGIASCSGSAG